MKGPGVEEIFREEGMPGERKQSLPDGAQKALASHPEGAGRLLGCQAG